MKSFQAQTHYEVLEISVGATLAEIKSAHERLTLLYGDDQIALYGLIDSAQSGALRARLKFGSKRQATRRPRRRHTALG